MSALSTWSEVRNASELRGLTIEIHSFGESFSKEWVRSEMDEPHWARICLIAETQPENVGDPQGFSWVSAVRLGDESRLLAPPPHIAALLAAEESQ